EVRDALAARRPRQQVEAMVETLSVWNPLGDEVLDCWLATCDGEGRVGSRFPAGWVDEGRELLRTYARLAAEHTRSRKHRRPKENLAVLLSCLGDQTRHGALAPRRRGLLQHVVDSMVARRGRPGSPEHDALRARQARDANLPRHHVLAQLLAARLAPP